MTEIIKSTNLKDVKADPGSLLEKLKGGGRFAPNLLLCDISGSMAAGLSTGQLAIEALREAVDTLTRNRPNTRIVVFHSMAWDVDSIPDCAGSTNLAGAFHYLHTNTPPKSLLLISDGHPDSEERAMAAADQLGATISALYIGERGSPGEDFLRRLCDAFGGSMQTDPELLETPELLADTIAGLLGAGNGGEEEDKGVIQL